MDIYEKYSKIIAIAYILKMQKFKRDKTYNNLDSICFYSTALFRDCLQNIKSDKEREKALEFTTNYAIRQFSKLDLKGKKYATVRGIIKELSYE